MKMIKNISHILLFALFSIIYINGIATPTGVLVSISATASGDGTCNTQINGTAQLLSNDGSCVNYCHTCFHPSGISYLDFSTDGTNYSTISGPVPFVCEPPESYTSYGITLLLNQYNKGAGYYKVRIRYTDGGLSGNPDCNSVNLPSNYIEYFQVFYLNPLAANPTNVSYNIDGNTISTSSGSPTSVWTCQALQMNLSANGVSGTNNGQYEIAITRNGGMTYTTSAASWQSTYDLKSRLTSLYGSDITGSYKIDLLVKNQCSSWVTYTGYITIYQTPTTVSTAFRINNKVLQTNISTPQAVYSCPTTLANISLTNLPTFNVNAQYRVTLVKVDATGNPISGFTPISSSWSNTSPPTDLKSASYNSWLANDANAGNYKVTLEARDMCGNAYTSTYGYIVLSPATATITSEMFGYRSDDEESFYGTYTPQDPVHTSISSPMLLCGASERPNLLWGIQATFSGILSKYTYAIYEDGTPTALYSSVLYSISGSNQIEAYLGESFLGGQVTYEDNTIYRVDLSVYNDCTYPASPIVKSEYFQVITTCKTDGSEATTGINETEANKVKVFPNPSSNIVNIQLTAELANGKVSLFNVLSEQVQVPVNSVSSTTQSIDVSKLSKGVYILAVNGNKIAQKIIVD